MLLFLNKHFCIHNLICNETSLFMITHSYLYWPNVSTSLFSGTLNRKCCTTQYNTPTKPITSTIPGIGIEIKNVVLPSLSQNVLQST